MGDVDAVLLYHPPGSVSSFCGRPFQGAAQPDSLEHFLANPEAGDITRSPIPGYHHKWQVAFYALALAQMIDRRKLSARISRKGFIMTPPPLRNVQETEPYQIHTFDLIPYLETLPTLLKHLGHVPSGPPAHADYRLQSLCTSCSGFSSCYHHALAHEPLRFLPKLTRGELPALQHMGCTTLEQLSHALENKRVFSSPGQQRKLAGWCDAFLNNRIPQIHRLIL